MIKLKKFRIKNYKSIIDSGDCYLATDITLLAGKNEAGKTSILEALDDFSSGKKIRESAKPINRASAEQPEISLTFNVNKEDMWGISQDIASKQKSDDEIEITLIKTFPDRYDLDEDSEALLFQEFPVKETIKLIGDKLVTIQRIVGTYPQLGIFPKERIDNFTLFNTQFRSFHGQAIGNLGKITDTEVKTMLTSDLAAVLDKLTSLEGHMLQKAIFLVNFIKYIPIFVLFSSFEDMLPAEVNLSEIDNKAITKDLALVSGLDKQILNQKNEPQKRKQHKTQINAQIKGDFRDYWKQNEVHLEIDVDGEKVQFFVMDGRQPFLPTQRSKGFQWFLAFYLRLQARKIEKFHTVLLIDEPGLYLHAKAQKDVLNVLTKICQSQPVVLSTHSPYLIDPKHLSRVRLVTYSETEGTKIKKLHAGADKETLTPILTAIGEDLGSGLKVDNKDSLIVEGISDYYYLQAFGKLVGYDNMPSIIPGTGGESPIYIGAIHFGWGLDPRFCLDSDKAGKRLHEEISKRLSIEPDRIIHVLDTEGTEGAIEDVLSIKDFKKYVLDGKAEYECSNSSYVGKNKADKVLLAKEFFEKVNSKTIILETLDRETKDNVTRLMKKIENMH